MTHRFDLSVLFNMLTYCRPSGSATETSFIKRFIEPLPTATQDTFGNWHVYIGESPILWSAHLDTVHRSGGRQTIHNDRETDVISLSKRARKTSNCLGADDTAGVFLLHQMIGAGIAGHYIFHYGEECGGEGSIGLSQEWPDLISDSLFAIALDRRGTSDVITHQCAGRCASEDFARSLSDQLNIHGDGLQYEPSSHGIFTDTAHYVDVIGECTNLSVGYGREHSKDEYLNVSHLRRLFSALCAIDPSALVSSRKPGDMEPRQGSWISVWRGTSDGVITSSYGPYCEFCGDEFDPSTSTAIDYVKYCDTDCENEDWKLLCARVGRTFLDPDYVDVQHALRRQSKRERSRS